MNVASRIVEDRVVDPHFGATESRGQLGYQLLTAVVARSEVDRTGYSGTVEPIQMPCGVPEFVKEGRVVGFRRLEVSNLGNADQVLGRLVACEVAALHNLWRIWH